MRLAKPSDFDEIVAVFKPMKGKYFPHLRQDLLKIRLSNSNVVYEDGVVIQFAPYKIRRKIGNVQAQVGDVHLEKIVTVKQGNGSAFTVMQDFLASINAQGKYWIILYHILKTNYCVTRFFWTNCT